jgi:hypothetical protein
LVNEAGAGVLGGAFTYLGPSDAGVVSGHAAAAPPSSVMNSRRFIIR